MALEQKLRLKLAQRLVMTPSLQQAIKLLQLSRLELEETLSQEILENPVLDVEEGVDDAAQEVEEGATTAEEAGAEETGAEETVAEAGTEDDPLPSAEETYEDIDVEAFFADYNRRVSEKNMFDHSESSDFSPPIPIVEHAPKIGRNQPCPCGSGKKYKKCCGSVKNADLHD